ncbi:MAG TPA: hypothetical protein VII06_17520 [Chloroflexota bacterium]
MYVNYCHDCGRALSSAHTERCDRCAWLRCECGACGCTYQASGVRAVLATIPPVWGAVAPRHVASARPSGSRLRAAGPAFVFATVAVVLAVGLAAVTSWLAPGVAEAPDLGQPAAAAQPKEEPPAGAVQTEAAEAPPAAEAPASPPLPVGSAPATVPAPASASSASASSSPAASVSAPASPVAEAAPLPPPPAAEPARLASAEAARPAAPAAAALPSVLYVGNTDGQGAYLRSQPRDGNNTRVVAWTDGTAMTPLETTSVQEAGGAATWVRVRDPRGDTGWVRQAYLRPAR